MAGRYSQNGAPNFEDCDECGFVARKPPDQPATNPLTNPLHAAIDIADGQRSLGRRLDELLEEPLAWRVSKALRSIRLAQAKNVERCETLIAELTREHLGHSEASAPTRSTLPAKEGMA